MSAVHTTVVMTTFDAAPTVGVALASALALPGDGHRVLVVDDGSTDGTPDLVAAVDDPRVTLVRAGRRGRALALNDALDRVRTPYLAVLDADDAALPPRIDAPRARLESDPGLALAGGAYLRLDLDDGTTARHDYPTGDAELRRALAYYGPFCHSTVTYRTAALRGVGGFDASLGNRIDQDAWVRLAAAGHRLANVEEVLAVHTKRAASYFTANQTELQRSVTMLRRNLAAIRALGLPRRLMAVAGARTAFRFLPPAVRARVTPGLEPVPAAGLAPEEARWVEALRSASGGAPSPPPPTPGPPTSGAGTAPPG